MSVNIAVIAITKIPRVCVPVALYLILSVSILVTVSNVAALHMLLPPVQDYKEVDRVVDIQFPAHFL